MSVEIALLGIDFTLIFIFVALLQGNREVKKLNKNVERYVDVKTGSKK